MLFHGGEVVWAFEEMLALAGCIFGSHRLAVDALCGEALSRKKEGDGIVSEGFLFSSSFFLSFLVVGCPILLGSREGGLQPPCRKVAAGLGSYSYSHPIQDRQKHVGCMYVCMHE